MKKTDIVCFLLNEVPRVVEFLRQGSRMAAAGAGAGGTDSQCVMGVSLRKREALEVGGGDGRAAT